MTVKKLEYDSPEYWQLLRLREIILRLPLGLRYSMMDIEAEQHELILALHNHHQWLATNQFSILGSQAKMRQVATCYDFQGQGIGSQLYLYSESYLKNLGIQEIYCHARLGACVFYEKLGFHYESDIFIEVGIPHRKMSKSLVRLDQ